MKFKTFIEQFKTLLCSIRGVRGITLGYVIRQDNHTTGPAKEVSISGVNHNNILSNDATLIGADFGKDNEKVYTIMRTILTSTPGWDVISKYASKKDGVMHTLP